MYQRAAPRPSAPDVVSSAASRSIANWRVFFAVTLVGAVLIGIINYGLLQALPSLEEAEDSPEQTREFFARAVPYLLAQVVVQVFTESAAIAAALHILRNQQPTAAASLATGLRRLPAGLAATVIFALVLLACLATIILIPLGLYFAVYWSMFVPLIIDERVGPIRALSRSRQLVRGNWWRTFGISASLFLLAFLINFIVAQIGGSDLISSAGAAVAALVTIPFLAMGLSVLYEDLRAVNPPPRPNQSPPPWERTDV